MRSRVTTVTACGVSRIDRSRRVAVRMLPVVYDCVPSVRPSLLPRPGAVLVTVICGKV